MEEGLPLSLFQGCHYISSSHLRTLLAESEVALLNFASFASTSTLVPLWGDREKQYDLCAIKQSGKIHNLS